MVHVMTTNFFGWTPINRFRLEDQALKTATISGDLLARSRVRQYKIAITDSG